MGLIRLGNKPPLTVAPEDTVVRAARAMTERRVGAATVLEGTGVVGVVTERDVMEKVVAAGGDPNTTRVRDIMSSPARLSGKSGGASVPNRKLSAPTKSTCQVKRSICIRLNPRVTTTGISANSK